MSDVNWGNYAEAYKAIHDKLDEILTKLDYPADPAVQDVIDRADRVLGKMVSVDSLESKVSNTGSIVAAQNTAGLAISVNNNFRTLCHFHVILGAEGEMRVESSLDGTDWRVMWTKTFSGTFADWELVGMPYFRINVPTTGIDITIEINAVKL